MARHYVQEEKRHENHEGITWMGILFDLALPVFMLLLWIVCFIFKIESGFHWLPLVACAAFYLCAGLLVYNATYYTESRFLQKKTLTGPPSINGKVQRWYFFDVEGKTREEVHAALKSRFLECDYLKKGRIKLVIFLSIGLCIAVIGCFINRIFLCTLVTYPIMILLTIFGYGPSVDGYLDTVYPKASYLSAVNWDDCVCPNCGAFCEPNATVRTNKYSSSTMTTYTRTTTDEYVYEDGKVIVKTEEERPAEVYNSSWVENHYCTRCKHKFSEKKSFSNTTRY